MSINDFLFRISTKYRRFLDPTDAYSVKSSSTIYKVIRMHRDLKPSYTNLTVQDYKMHFLRFQKTLHLHSVRVCFGRVCTWRVLTWDFDGFP